MQRSKNMNTNYKLYGLALEEIKIVEESIK